MAELDPDLARAQAALNALVADRRAVKASDLPELAQRAAVASLPVGAPGFVVEPQAARLLPYLRQAAAQGADAQRAAAAPLVAALLAIIGTPGLSTCLCPDCKPELRDAVRALEQHFAPLLVVERQGAPCPEAR